MNSDDTKKRINQMCEFIKQEAKEKANEIKIKTQEEFETLCRPYGCQKVVLTSGENGYGIPELQAVLNAAVAAEDQEAE